MDVRCEKCSTEYELDESRLKPGGVTVKCTNCGHMFKIRKRADTAVQAPTSAVGMPRAQPSAQLPAPSVAAAPAPALARSSASVAAESGERQWLIRLEHGETRSCRELVTLQQWIIAGEVTREALISRSGKTWKLLGDIVELGSYFTIADEARSERAKRESVKHPVKKLDEPRSTLIGVGVSSGAMALGDLDDIENVGDNDPTTARRVGGAGARTALLRTASIGDDSPTRVSATPASEVAPPRGKNSGSVVAAAQAKQPAWEASAAPLAIPPPAGWPAVSPSPAPISPPVAAASFADASVSGRESNPWTGPMISADPGGGPAHGADGPVSGRFLQSSGNEPAFAGSNQLPRPPMAVSQPFTGLAHESSAGVSQRLSVADSGRFAPDLDRGPEVAPRGSRAGLWIAIASLAVIAGGFAIVYMLVIRGPATSPMVIVPAVSGRDAGADAPPTVALAPDAAARAPDVALALASTIDNAAVDLAGNVEARMRSTLARLSEPGEAKDDAASLAIRSRLATSIAQSLEDRAALLPARDRNAADKLRQSGKSTVLTAVPLAQRALKSDASSASANLAMADLLRLQGKPTREVHRYLDAARASAPGSIDVALIDGLLLLRDGKLGEAATLWSKVDSGDARLEQSGDVRLRLRLAMIAFAEGKVVDARAAIDAVLAAQPEHESAKALAARIDRAVLASDPLPVEEGRDDGSASAPVAVLSSESYEKLVQRADRLAENRGCGKAIELFQSALEKRPNGVEALIGLGYCHIENKQFSSANSRFRTVLALQSKNERALWGIAQLYQEQGLNTQAIEAFRRYLDVFPNAAPAKRQLERLGAQVDEPSGPAGEETPVPVPETPPAPAPATPTTNPGDSPP